MNTQNNELSPVSMITEQLSKLHISDENAGVFGIVRSLDVKKYIFGATASFFSPSPEKKGDFEQKSSNSSDRVFYAVNVPKKGLLNHDGSGDTEKEEPNVFENIEEALKIVKSHKHARFKSFTSREEAVKFALQSTESISLGSINGSLASVEDEDGLPSVKCQDLVKLRKAIEEGNEENFKKMVWENARYLVNYHGDTPAILHEGFRYNALHIAARCKKPLMCQLILDTLGDPKFFDRIYKCDPEIREEKIHHLLDQYLNNPDKRLGETPLHFAAKFGCLHTVKILLSHPYCIKDKKNKYGETAEQTICTRCSSANDTLRKEMQEAFKGLMYVPVLRTEDNVIPPCIEKPLTKTEIEKKFYSSLQSISSPNFRVKAFAGPMSPEAAEIFYKIWKNPSSTPQRQAYTVDEQKCIYKIRLTDTEKGLERAGRNIAQDLHAEWIEYWPVLDSFVNLSSTKGLKMLEAHLSKFNELSAIFSKSEAVSEEITESSPDNQQNSEALNSVSYINPLGHYLNSLLKDKDSTCEEYEDDVYYTPPSSPQLARHKSHTSESELFINGSELTRLDIDMYLAIIDVNVDTALYPYVYKWKKFIRSKLSSIERNQSNPKSLTPLASIRIPRLQRRDQVRMSPRNLFFKSEEDD